MNLMEGLLNEVTRNKELEQDYVSIGAPGTFALTHIRADIELAKKAIADNDVVEMVRMYEILKGKK